MMDNVTHIGDWIIRQRADRRYGRSDECQHFKLQLDDKGEIVKCEDCGVQVSAYWALKLIVDHYRRAIDKVKAEQAKLAQATESSRHLIAARRVEQAWRRRDMVPACPHCGCGIMTSDGLGDRMISKEIELRRRAVQQQRED